TWDVAPAPRPLADYTLRELLGAAGMGGDPGPGGVAFAIDDLTFVERGACPGCGAIPVQRFVPGDVAGLRCPACRGPAHPQPFYTHRFVPGSLLVPLSDRPLRRIGAASPRSVLVRGAGRAVL